ncbi:MAG: c-type cytochrome [Mucilaginibacter sp.]
MKIRAICIIGLLLAVLVACQSEDALEFSRYYSSGKVVYQSRCQNCHGDKGEGLSALIPPLTDSVYLKANKQQLACMVKYGMNAPITINKKAFYNKMPLTDLAPVEIAEVLTYVNNSFGNKMGVVTTAMAEGDLKNCK